MCKVTLKVKIVSPKNNFIANNYQWSIIQKREGEPLLKTAIITGRKIHNIIEHRESTNRQPFKFINAKYKVFLMILKPNTSIKLLKKKIQSF